MVGGNAWQMIIGFVDESFGINTYERLLQPNADELTSIQSRGLTGQRVAMREQFRDDYRLINYIKFGKLPQELDVNSFGFSFPECGLEPATLINTHIKSDLIYLPGFCYGFDFSINPYQPNFEV